MATRVRLNSRGVKEILNAVATRTDLTLRANRVLSQAQSLAPVASGEYRDSLEVVQDTTDRAVVRVTARATHGFVVEARLGVLAKSLDAGR